MLTANNRNKFIKKEDNVKPSIRPDGIIISIERSPPRQNNILATIFEFSNLEPFLIQLDC